MVNNLMEVTVKVMSMEEGGIPCAAEGMGGCFRCPIVLQNKMSVLYLSTTASLSSSLS